MLKQRIGLIGAGQMATALAEGFVKAGLVAAESLLAADPDQALLRALVREPSILSGAGDSTPLHAHSRARR